MNFDNCFAFTMKQEGGFVNNPSDPGGMTNHGVTKHVWESWVGHKVDEKAMRALTLDAVKPLYQKKYWDVCRCGDLPKGIDMVVFDTAVNSGATKAAKILQNCLNTVADGIIGPKTVQLAANADPKKIIEKYCNARLAFLQGLDTFKVFGHGWANRISQLRSSAMQIV